MENDNEKLNSGIKNIQNIKMTMNEKSQIFQSIIGETKIKEMKAPKKHNIFQMFPNYNLYLRTAVYFILLASVGSLFWFNYQNTREGFNYIPNNYTNNNMGAPIENKNSDNQDTQKNTQDKNSQQINKSGTVTNSGYQSTTSSGMASALAPVIIYKTKNDYSNNIRVCYNNGEITCFPGPTDVIHQRPIKLEDGYFLNKMSGNAILNVTIDELINYGDDWFNLIKKENIIDYKPFTEMYSCPSVWGIEEINKAILSDKLKTECKNILND